MCFLLILCKKKQKKTCSYIMHIHCTYISKLKFIFKNDFRYIIYIFSDCIIM